MVLQMPKKRQLTGNFNAQLGCLNRHCRKRVAALKSSRVVAHRFDIVPEVS
jgi:hypothetical protein